MSEPTNLTLISQAPPVLIAANEFSGMAAVWEIAVSQAYLRP